MLSRTQQPRQSGLSRAAALYVPSSVGPDSVLTGTKACTSPITDQSTNGCTGAFGDGAVMNSETTIVMKKTRAKVPMNSAMYAAGPRST